MSKDLFTESSLAAKGYVYDAVNEVWVKGKPPAVAAVSSLPSLDNTLADYVKKNSVKKTPDKQVHKHVVGELPLRHVSIVLKGDPMPKQSARFFCTKKINTENGRHIIASFQPKEMEVRKKDYQAQMKAQLTESFVRFERRVHVRKLHYVYPPLKGFSKSIMQAINAGQIVYKETQPDLVDNLKKLVFDSMAGIVFANDGSVVSEDNVKKYYGLGGCIIIELEGC